MKWCCPGFEGSFQNRHDRGLYVFVLPPESNVNENPTFHIACRMVEKEHLDTLRDKIGSTSFPVSLSTRTGMQFCPWCGANLRKFYKKSYGEMIDESIVEEENNI